MAGDLSGLAPPIFLSSTTLRTSCVFTVLQGVRHRMADKPQPAETKVDSEQPAVTAPAPPPRRAPGHRSTDARDTVAEMALRAQEISQEAGSKIAQAIKDVINAAAGITGFAVESARDIVQYMVRRGQMTQEEADRVIREAEEAGSRRQPGTKVVAPPTPQPPRAPAAVIPPAPKPAPPLPKPAVVKAPAPAPARAAASTRRAPAVAKPSKPAHPRKPAPKPAPKKKPVPARARPVSRPAGKKKR